MKLNNKIREGAKAKLKESSKLNNMYLDGKAEEYGGKVFTIEHIEWNDEDYHLDGIDHVKFEGDWKHEWQLKDIECIVE
jgi:hypothetical protein